MATPTVLCVIPTRWPLSEVLRFYLATWLADCDRVILSVSFSELRNTADTVSAARVPLSVVATHERQNTTSKFDTWIPVRSAIAFAGANNMSSMDWMLYAEDDAYVSMSRLRSFLQRYKADEPTLFGSCSCGRMPGLAVISSQAWAKHGSGIAACPPDHKRDRYDRIGIGAGDRTMLTCAVSLGLRCRTPLDERGQRAIFVHTRGNVRQATVQMLSLLTNVTSVPRISFCKRWNCAPKNAPKTCWSGDAFGFHGMPLKDVKIARRFDEGLKQHR